MSVHIEWHEAKSTTPEVLTMHDDWVGANEQNYGQMALTLSGDEVTAITGTPDELLALAKRITAAVEAGVKRAEQAEQEALDELVQTVADDAMGDGGTREFLHKLGMTDEQINGRLEDAARR